MPRSMKIWVLSLFKNLNNAYQAGDVNLYRFVGNDPVNGVDPYGLQTLHDGGTNCAGGAIRGCGYFYPDNSNKNFLEQVESQGYSCHTVSSSSECNCKCGQRKVIVTVWLNYWPENKGKNPFTDPTFHWWEPGEPGIQLSNSYTYPVHTDIHAAYQDNSLGQENGGTCTNLTSTWMNVPQYMKGGCAEPSPLPRDIADYGSPYKEDGKEQFMCCCKEE